MNLIILGMGSFAKEITDELPYAVNVLDYVTSDSLIRFRKPNVNCNFIAAIVSTKRKQFIEEFYELTQIEPVSIIHKSVYCSKLAKIEKGIIICPNATIANSTIVKNYCIINRGATIGHDCIIDKYSTIGPGVNIAGNVKIGTETIIGIGANIIENIIIGNNCTIGAGSLVTKNIPDNQVWYGLPARYIRENTQP